MDNSTAFILTHLDNCKEVVEKLNVVQEQLISYIQDQTNNYHKTLGKGLVTNNSKKGRKQVESFNVAEEKRAEFQNLLRDELNQIGQLFAGVADLSTNNDSGGDNGVSENSSTQDGKIMATEEDDMATTALDDCEEDATVAGEGTDDESSTKEETNETIFSEEDFHHFNDNGDDSSMSIAGTSATLPLVSPTSDCKHAKQNNNVNKRHRGRRVKKVYKSPKKWRRMVRNNRLQSMHIVGRFF